MENSVKTLKELEIKLGEAESLLEQYASGNISDGLKKLQERVIAIDTALGTKKVELLRGIAALAKQLYELCPHAGSNHQLLGQFPVRSGYVAFPNDYMVFLKLRGGYEDMSEISNFVTKNGYYWNVVEGVVAYISKTISKIPDNIQEEMRKIQRNILILQQLELA